jgi:transcriptional regulator with XRE-family HTH domain
MSTSTTHPSRILLDTDTIRARRQALKIGDNDLAARLGVSISVIRLLEAGTNHDVLSLGLVGKLAEVLGTDLRDLLLRADIEPATADDNLDDDRRRLHAALEEVGRVVNAEELAKGLGWQLRRVYPAARALRSALSDSGQQLAHTSGVGYALMPREGILTTAERQRLHRARTARHGIRHADARILRTIMHGQLDAKSYKATTEATRISVQSLRNLGLVSQTPAGDWQLTAGTRSSLLVDELMPDGAETERHAA